MSTLSLNGINNLGNAYARSIKLINASGGWDDIITLINANSGGGITIAQVQALLASYTNTVGLNTLLASYTNTNAITLLLAQKQATVSSSTDLTMRDVTLRNIQAQTAIMLLRDNAGATAVEVQASLIGLYKSTNMHETVNFHKAISLTNTASSLTNQLYIGTGNKLQWGGQEVCDLPTILGLIASKVTAGSGISRISNGSTGAVELSLNQSFAHNQLSFNGSSSNLRNVTQNSVDTLVYGSDNLITTPVLTTQLATKQNLLAGVSVTGGAFTSTGTEVYVGNYTSSFLLMTCSGGPPGRYGLLMSSAATFGLRPPPGATLTLLSPQNGVALTVASASPNMTYHGTLTSASDRRLKTEIEDVSTDDCQILFDAVTMKTYKRIDQKEENRPYRLGLIAQDVQSALPSDGKFANLIGSFEHGEDDNQQEMLSVSYDRLTCVLWTVVKNQQKQIDELIAKVNILST
jgi:hypothetical protein